MNERGRRVRLVRDALGHLAARESDPPGHCHRECLQPIRHAGRDGRRYLGRALRRSRDPGFEHRAPPVERPWSRHPDREATYSPACASTLRSFGKPRAASTSATTGATGNRASKVLGRASAPSATMTRRPWLPFPRQGCSAATTKAAPGGLCPPRPDSRRSARASSGPTPGAVSTGRPDTCVRRSCGDPWTGPRLWPCSQRRGVDADDPVAVGHLLGSAARGPT